jgi:hypothetical protein
MDNWQIYSDLFCHCPVFPDEMCPSFKLLPREKELFSGLHPHG